MNILLMFYGGTIMNDDLKGKILWCSKIKKGVKIVVPNENLCSAYLKKANDSLTAMNLISTAKLYDWAADAAYYSRYHAIYALLQKCGIESEIHDCSILSIKFLFSDKISATLIKELENAKNQRVDLVYYTNRGPTEEELKKNIALASNFVLVIEKVIFELKQEDIKEIRQKLS